MKANLSVELVVKCKRKIHMYDSCSMKMGFNASVKGY